MAQDWVMLPIEQLVRDRARGVLKFWQCAICNAQTVPDTEQTAAEQIRIHLERYHEAVAESATNQTSARLRKKLTKMGWISPADDEPGPPGPAGATGITSRDA